MWRQLMLTAMRAPAMLLLDDHVGLLDLIRSKIVKFLTEQGCRCDGSGIGTCIDYTRYLGWLMCFVLLLVSDKRLVRVYHTGASTFVLLRLNVLLYLENIRVEPASGRYQVQEDHTKKNQSFPVDFFLSVMQPRVDTGTLRSQCTPDQQPQKHSVLDFVTILLIFVVDFRRSVSFGFLPALLAQAAHYVYVYLTPTEHQHSIVPIAACELFAFASSLSLAHSAIDPVNEIYQVYRRVYTLGGLEITVIALWNSIRRRLAVSWLLVLTTAAARRLLDDPGSTLSAVLMSSVSAAVSTWLTFVGGAVAVGYAVGAVQTAIHFVVFRTIDFESYDGTDELALFLVWTIEASANGVNTAGEFPVFAAKLVLNMLSKFVVHAVVKPAFRSSSATSTRCCATVLGLGVLLAPALLLLLTTDETTVVPDKFIFGCGFDRMLSHSIGAGAQLLRFAVQIFAEWKEDHVISVERTESCLFAIGMMSGALRILVGSWTFCWLFLGALSSLDVPFFAESEVFPARTGFLPTALLVLNVVLTWLILVRFPFLRLLDKWRLRRDSGRLVDAMRTPTTGDDRRLLGDVCPICWMTMESTDSRITPCGHAFHRHCLVQCVMRLRWRCPMCRAPISLVLRAR